MTEQPPQELLDQATDFGDTVTELLAESLPEAPAMELTTKGSRASLAPAGRTEKSGGVPLFAKKQRLAWLRIDFLCRLDTTQEFLAIDKSKIWIVADVDSTPIFRFEFPYEADWVPHSHIQVTENVEPSLIYCPKPATRDPTTWRRCTFRPVAPGSDRTSRT